jgi:hypothetical protein
MKLLFEATAEVQAPLKDVVELIDNGWVLEAFLASSGQPADNNYIDVDQQPGVVGFQGHWWYRGEISAETVEGRTMLRYRVWNIAERGAWAVPLANKFFVGYQAKVQQSTQELAHAVNNQLSGGPDQQR